MKRSAALARRTPLDRGGAPERRTELARAARPRPGKLTALPISPATAEQKAKVAGRPCVADGAETTCRGPIDPAHVIDRSLAPAVGDDGRAVVPLCRGHHREYDNGELDLSPFLEPHWRTEIAFAVESVGLFPALRRITGRRWLPENTQPGGTQ